jgi:MFS family permease
LIDIILNVVNMISATGVSFFVDRAGRRPLMIGSAVAMCLCYTVQTITLAQYTKTQSPAASYTFVVFVFIYYISYNIGFMGLLVSYTSEIMPYRIRAKGLTVMFFAVDLALFFNQYVTGIAIRAISYWYYVCYCIWIAFEAFFVWKFYIETKNTPLEEIARHFDGDAALVDDDTGLRKNGDSRGSGAGLGLGPEVSDMGVRKRRMEDGGSDEKIQVERRE